jgi:hypothetical protein
MAVAAPARPSTLAPSEPAQERTSWAWGLAGCLLLALALRVPYFGTSLGRDEGGVAFIAQNWPSGHGSLYGSYWLDRPPLLVGLYRVAVLGGDVGVRLLGAVAALALVAAVASLAREVAGQRAGLIAGLLAALLSGSLALASVYTPAELLAAVPSTLSVLCLVLAHRRRATRYVFAAGLLAVTALLIKQSFLDAGLAGLVFAVAARDGRARRLLAYAAGVAIPVAALLAWQVAAQLPDGGFVYALVGFRIDALHTLAASNIPLRLRLEGLERPALVSGLLLVVGLALAGLPRLRGDRVLLATFGAWFAGAAVGVLGGGSYWSHYLIELVPVSCVAAAVGLAGRRRVTRTVALGACTAVALIAAVGGVVQVSAHPPHQQAVAVGRYVRTHAHPGDTQYVMYAQANTGYYSGLPSPYPYAWSLMVRAKPGAIAQLQSLLGSARRPTWLVKAQPARRWGLDPNGRTRRLIASHYRLAATVQGQRVYERNDR